ncbi:non-ribosomal peptide synthetase [Chitinophaga sp. HK235]|uniref:non-ribosomal peptide synthetase n=1 Tax=Chitinophaga sp. HK235 TaxID=2952571 RepID=UPI001BAA1EB5|nr:non-ribosomal peptide synthetase [Chitinophaga sp. HK235]
MTSVKLKDILSLLEKANSIGIKISLDDNELVVQVQKDQEIDSAFLHELKHNKEYIVEYLKDRKQNGRTGFTGSVSAYDRKGITHIPLSYSQERLWFIHQLEGSVQYHIPAMLRISGPLDSHVLADTLRTIVDRHEILRTVIAQEEGEMYQRILAKGQLPLTIVAGEAYREDDNALKNYVRLLADAPFDLEKDLMLRAHLIVLDKEEHVLVVVLHHIVSDAWSSGIILQELVTLYDAHTAGKTLQLPDLPVQYADYAIWQRSEVINVVLERKLEYWKEKLRGATMLQLPSDHQRPADQRYSGSSASFVLDNDLSARLRALSLQQDATLYMTMLAVFKVLLHRYSGQDDIVVGSSTAGRQLRELEGLVGFFSNTLTLRSDLGNDPSFISLLQQVKQTTLEAFDHQDVPFGKVVEAVVKERDKRGNPLFQVMFVQQNRLDIAGIALGKATVYPELIEQTTSKFDLTLFIQETSTGINVYTEYNAGLFTPDTIDRLQGHFEVLLRAAVDAPAAHISSLNMLRSDERMLLLNGSDKEAQYLPLSDKSILTQFEEQAVRHPNTIALISENNTITYRHLNERANQLANYLRSNGVGAGTLVPVCMERSSEMIVAILGILKAGGAYVPLEPTLPAERIAYVLTDTAATVVISNSLYKSILPGTGTCGIISTDDDAAEISSFPTEAPGVCPAADQLLYVIYTSGSTGKPKGVMVTHGNITDYMAGLQARLNIDSCRSFGLLSSIATDLGNTVIYSSLAVGGTLHVLSKALTNDAEKIKAYFNQHRIDCIKVVPSHWKALCAEDALLLPEKLLIFGGEALEVAVVEKIRRSGTACTVVNHYGPTETTIGKLLHIVEDGRLYEDTIPIGKPFSSAYIYILDTVGNPCPVGIPGELYIGGKGVAQGYLNNAALTTERFIHDPFRTGSEKLYRTGDRVKYLADGNVVFLGRIDNQVKIRGYRVEPGEIENVIMQHADIIQAVVQVREDNSGNSRLVGYVQPHSHADITSLEAYLKEQLPDYMVPSSWVVMEQFPQLPNGKIDRRSLPVDDVASSISGYVAPVTDIERDLADIWSDLLKVEQVGLYDDFFALGGHSLLAIRLISSIRKKLQTEVAIGDIFDYPTIAALSAQLLHRSEATLALVIKSHTRPEYIPLSYSQERLWFIDQLEGSIQYNRPAVLRLKGTLKIKALDDALREIVNRHEVLRTVIRSKDGQPYQYVLGKDTWRLRLTERTLPHAAVSAHIKALVEEPFDLSADHMLRAHLIAQEDDHLLVIVLHHIASDGWSLGILVRELTTLYNAYAVGNGVQLPAPGIQYADYAIWQRAHLSGPVLEEKLAYWQQKLSGITTLRLPSDYSRPALQSTRGDVINFNISKSVMLELQQLGRLYGGTLYMTLLAAFKVLLYRYSGQEDICVGSPVSGRSQLETEELIGFFINTLTLRSNLHDNPSFSSLLQQIKETALEAFAHQEVPFGKIVEAVVKERDAGRSPLFQVLFSLQNTPDIPELYLNELQVSEMQVEHSTAQFDLAVSMRETENGLWGDIEYSTDLFSADTIRRMIRHFQRLLEAVAQSPDERIDNLEMLTAEEEHTLLSISAGQTTENLLHSGKTVVSLFEERVTNIPDTTAVITAGGSFSFRDIDTRANQLAHYLIASGVKEETLVPLCMDLSVEMIIGILGVLKAGAAYVPLDPGLPPARLEYMLKDTAAIVVITNRKTHQTLHNQTNIKTLILDINGDATHHYPVFAPAVTPDLHHLAYVIYTSGSTGVPKGVMVAHGNLLHYLLNSKTAYLNENKTGTGSYLHLSYTFDASLTALFMPLLAGKSIVLGSGNQATAFEDPLFWKYAPYDFIKLTPAHLPLLEVAMNNHPAEYPAEKLVLGGEALQLTALRYLLDKKWDIEIINEYGPTEATVGCSIYRFNTQDPIDVQNNTIPIGKPIDNTAIYIFDRNLKMTPVGIAGEIYIGGGGVARGYLHLPELTSDRFVSASSAHGGRERLYRTGDIAKWLPDGNIEYLGREDDQVKIRGYRIALGEIEGVLTRCTLVRQAVVIFDTDENGNQRLIGYVVPEGDFDQKGIDAYLKEHLPHYMLPSFLIGVPELALTVNGKIDRKSLPAPDTSVQIISAYIAPRSETEKTMAAIWESLLDVTGIGIYDDFFTLGGHSLLAVRLLSAIKKSLQTDLSVSDIFSSPTIASLCELITTRSGKLLLPAITAAERPKHIPLSYSQERLWFIDQLEGSTQYHIPAVLRLEGHLNRNALGNALQTIVNRHEVLRTVISQNGGHAYQQVLDKGSWQMIITDSSGAGAGNENAYIKSLIDVPFDLSKDHMLRAHLVVLEENVHLLVVTLHHIASDGWSASIIVKELVELYNAYTEGREPILPALNIQYADYALWQRRHLQGAALNKQLTYWKKKLTGVPSLDLPLDYERPVVNTTAGGLVTLMIDNGLAEDVRNLSRQFKVTLYMTLLAAFKVLLYRYSGQKDICVGGAIAARLQQETEGLIGFFVNSLVLRSDLGGNPSFADLLLRVKETMLEAYDNQEAPFEKIVEMLMGERDVNKNPLFQVMFVLQNTPEEPEIRLGDVSLSVEIFPHTTSRLDLGLAITEEPEGLRLDMEYRTDLFKQETINGMLKHYEALLRSAVNAHEKPMGALSMLSDAEQQQLLVGFNSSTSGTERSVVRLFEEQVNNTPDAVALVFEDMVLTYRQLDQRANQLGHYLRMKGVKEETLVPLCIDRTPDMIVGILGILKAGGAYVPIDPSIPAERITFMLKDIAAQVMVSNTLCKLCIKGESEIEIVVLDDDWEDISRQPVTKVASRLKEENVAYVIYTSGSTGKPKGVLIEHRSLINLIVHQSKIFDIKSDERVLLLSNYSFDASVEQIFFALLNGAALVLAPSDIQLDIRLFEQFLRDARITHLEATPGFLATINPGKYDSLRRMISGGELCKRELAEKWYKQLDFYNVYGPTEATISAVAYHYLPGSRDKSAALPIGKPLTNVTVYILDEYDNAVPVGAAGELCIGGPGVARGYLNNPELTTQKFIADPFSQVAGARLYKTGDKARWLSDGNIEYLGRLDDQVKIRGYRVELGELEYTLNQQDAITACCVVMKPGQAGNNKLVSYYVPDKQTVKRREQELFLKQVENWKELYDTEYTKNEEAFIADEEFNIEGWNDSFTGSPIAADEMREWQQDILDVILSHKPVNVLEIGCGSGLIYYPLAGHIKRYIGTDFSAVSLRKIRNRIDNGGKVYPSTLLKTCAAHEITLDGNEVVDTIVLNSVVQYFPGENYLTDVIAASIPLLKGKGQIIIGDVRDYRLLQHFRSRVRLPEFQDKHSVKEFMWEVNRDLLKEQELCLAPEYFHHLKTLFPEITHIALQWKKGDYINELILYRYTVIIYVGVEQPVLKPEWQQWEQASGSGDVISALNRKVPVVALQGVPNPRLQMDILLEKGLKDSFVTSTGDLSAYIAQDDRDCSRVNELLLAAVSNGYHYRFLLNEDPLKTDLLIELEPFAGFVSSAYDHQHSLTAVLGNNPLFNDFSESLHQDIRRRLKEQLPEYMIPAEFVPLPKLPLTTNGKADRQFLSTWADQRESSIDRYEAPATEIERHLAGIWQDLLGVPRIGLHDNFFELGGDSIITIQVISRARHAGYELHPRDLFLYQTVAKLATLLTGKTTQQIVGEQGLLTGNSGLLPIQQWYFDLDNPTDTHFNQSILLAVDKRVSSGRLSAAVSSLLQYHDALRFSYRRADGKWEQRYTEDGGKLEIVDLQPLPVKNLSVVIAGYADIYQHTTNPATGLMLRAVLLLTPAAESHNRLLLVVHHLAIDSVSWRILLDDLHLLLKDESDNSEAVLGRKGSSYRQWYEALAAYGSRPRLLGQIPYWEQVVKDHVRLPVDTEYEGTVTIADMEDLHIRLDALQTQRLLQEVPRAYHTEINDVLLCALALTLLAWSGHHKVSIGLESHGREDHIVPDIDTSHTVGWFTNMYPVSLEMKADSGWGEQLKSVKEQLRKIVDKGIGYGVLKYINREDFLQTGDAWDIVFNYLGQTDNVAEQDGIIHVATEPTGAGIGEGFPIRYKLMVTCSVYNGELIFRWGFSKPHYTAGTIEKLTDTFLSFLNTLIDHCTEQAVTGTVFTPADYGLGNEVSIEELDRFLDAPYNGKPRRAQIQGLYRLSNLQEGMLFHALYNRQAGIYTEQLSGELIGLKETAFLQSWEHLMQCYTVLRSAFYHNELKVPVQCVYRDVTLPLTVLDYRGMTGEEQQQALTAYEAADRAKGIDLAAAPLMRISVIRLEGDRYWLLWTFHHILLDGWSISLLVEKLLDTYALLATGAALPEVTEDRYEDYIRYQERLDKDVAKSYWRRYLEGLNEGCLLPFTTTASDSSSDAGAPAVSAFKLDVATTASLKKYTQRHRITLNTLMQGVWAYLLYRYTSREDVVFGVTVSGRPDNLPGVEQRVGLYINTLPLHMKVDTGRNITEWLRDIQMQQLQSRIYQYFNLNEIQRETAVTGDMFDSVLVFENYPEGENTSRPLQLQIENVAVKERISYPLSITIGATEEIKIRFTYNEVMLPAAYAEAIAAHFRQVLLQIASPGTDTLGAISLLTPEEQHRILNIFNNTQVVYNSGDTIADQIIKQAHLNPDAIALVYGKTQWSYARLHERSNQLAHYLRSLGVQKETLVPVCLERSPEIVVAMLGIIKAGGAYVPIDPAYPPERINYMLTDTGAEIIITSNDIILDLTERETPVKIIVPDDAIAYPVTETGIPLDEEQLANVIYTSGSTGNPKGVMIAHKGLMNMVHWYTKAYDVTSSARATVVTGVGFDVFGWEVWPHLCSGATVFMLDDTVRSSPHGLERIYTRHEITHSLVFTAIFGDVIRQIRNKPLALKYLLTGGDRLGPTDITGLTCRLFNNYGPTENSVITTYYELSEKDKDAIPPIGIPVNNTIVYIINKEQQLCPVGVWGEICVSGKGVSRGYLHQDELTREKFVANPFDATPGSRMYKTGDIGRWLPDGNIEYLGRRDEQVKIRGYRIELGEIEQTLQQCSLVDQAVVSVSTDSNGNKRLIGYVVARNNFDKEEIAAFLSAKLPEYMIPSLFIAMEKLPLTANGKIDRKALPDPEVQHNIYVAPSNEVEQTLLDIWQGLLSTDRIGTADDFFEVGGDSLLAVRVIAHIKDVYNINVSVSTVFECRNVVRLAEYVMAMTGSPETGSRTEFETYEI